AHATSAPARARAIATARPTPRLAPVTSATLPAISIQRPLFGELTADGGRIQRLPGTRPVWLMAGSTRSLPTHRHAPDPICLTPPHSAVSTPVRLLGGPLALV